MQRQREALYPLEEPQLSRRELFIEEQQFYLYTAPRFVRGIIRTDALRAASEFGSILTDPEGRTRSYASFFPAALKHTEQLERDELPGYAARAQIRAALADKIEREVLPISTERWLERYPMRLRTARQTGSWGLVLETERPIVYWDAKAGLSRLCPDDAREEAKRLERRYAPVLEEWTAKSRAHRLTYMVFTRPNSAPGKLRAGMEKIFADFRRLLKSGAFPAIKGALAVLEAPLGAARDWNVHLNVLVMHDGFVEWGKLRQRWHWNVHMQQLAPGAGAIGRALRELIKYAAAATVAKSEEKAHHVGNHGTDGGGPRTGAGCGADTAPRSPHPSLSADPAAGAGQDRGCSGPPGRAPGRYPAPPMLEWTGAELTEWLLAFHGHRRTRSYGALFDLDRPPPEPVGKVAWLGRIEWHRDHYEHRLALLDSIQEDKSRLEEGPQDRRTVWDRWVRRLALDHLEPIGEPAVSLNDIYAAIEQNPMLDRIPPRS